MLEAAPFLVTLSIQLTVQPHKRVTGVYEMPFLLLEGVDQTHTPASHT